MSNSARLDFIKSYFAMEEKITLEIKPVVTETIKGTVIKRFNGKRAGIEFKEGIGYCERKEVQNIKDNFPHIIIHLPEETKGSVN
ncbi:hypothetical protein P2R12_20680 [Cytobacillus oceanisediminis]|uniref:hypothetical protein n=1 Tax=Cytobacillus oceanisediminis TaxID=665099 RepID=UPI0023D9C775|nr:hypothetical protein [Cytobacillus oceanisediminis]MDF2039352.1 hypothetical protein [Cytobacillus oceanisediminis]